MMDKIHKIGDEEEEEEEMEEAGKNMLLFHTTIIFAPLPFLPSGFIIIMQLLPFFTEPSA